MISNLSQTKFWTRVKKTSKCWLWIGDKNEKGYGRYNNQKAHRISFSIHNKKLIGNFHVLHRCDNPSCVNPLHLFLGTHKDNMQDKILKRRDHNQNKKNCRNGHPYSGTNLIRKKSGERRCRICHNQQLRRLRARNGSG